MLRGRLGKAFGSFGGVLGGFWELLEPLETPLGASGASQGGSWVLPEHIREALGSSRDALGSISGCFWLKPSLRKLPRQEGALAAAAPSYP